MGGNRTFLIRSAFPQVSAKAHEQQYQSCDEKRDCQGCDADQQRVVEVLAILEIKNVQSPHEVIEPPDGRAFDLNFGGSGET
jgi:hypothetical protein